jgi:regulator of replication initiation timing
MQLLNHAKKENDALKIENERLKKEIATMNINIVASLERDILHMHKELNKVNTYIPKYNRTVEDLDP